MLPAQQRFMANQRAIKLHRFQIVQLELAGGEANPRFRQQAAARFGFIGHAGIITAPAAAAGGLGAIQRQIGLLVDAGQRFAAVF